MNELKLELKKLIVDTLKLDDVQAEEIADYEPLFREGLGLDTVATIHDGSPYGEGLVGETGAAFEALGGEIVGKRSLYHWPIRRD